MIDTMVLCEKYRVLKEWAEQTVDLMKHYSDDNSLQSLIKEYFKLRKKHDL